MRESRREGAHEDAGQASIVRSPLTAPRKVEPEADTHGRSIFLHRPTCTSLEKRPSHAPGATTPAVPLECPRIMSTDLNSLICKTDLAVGAPGGVAQRMNSVAWRRRDDEMVRPRAWAVLRLITNSKIIGCSTGRSAGLAPFRILST